MRLVIPAAHPDLSSAIWRKARASDGGGGCVELAALADGRVALRDSKHPDDPAHVFTRHEIACLLAGAKAGEFDDLAT